jgi:energy-coupling factor transporter ATP-binding protein EcfA2
MTSQNIAVSVRGVSFTYAGSSRGPSLNGIDFEVLRGEVVVITGGSGSGKSSLLRLVNGLIPHYHAGKLAGTVTVAGINVASEPLYETARHVGSVFQNPKTQFFAVETDSELAFGPENLGVDPQEIRRRIANTATRFGLQELMGDRIFQLSGGQKQRLACASVDAQSPDVLVLDEPSANLDQNTINKLTEIIAEWKQLGKTVLIAEHRLAYLVGLADRFLTMESGRITRNLGAAGLADIGSLQRSVLGLRSLSVSDINSLPLGSLQRDKSRIARTAGAVGAASRETLALQNFSLRRKNEPDPVVDIPAAELPLGEIVAITGLNGAGKTTFARMVSGLERRSRGTLRMGGRLLKKKRRIGACAMVMQDVNHQLFTDSVLDEVLLSMPEPDEELAVTLLEQLGLDGLESSHPLALSGGQKQRLAVASVLASKKPLVILDEPTSGLDYRHMRAVADLLRTLKSEGRSVFVITHDPELIEEACTWRVHFEAGRLISGPVHSEQSQG